MSRSLIAALIALMLASAAMACGGGSSSTSSPTTPAAVTVPVVAPTPTTVTVDGSAPTIGASSQFTATAKYSDGTTTAVTTLGLWQSSSPLVATVSANGLVTGQGAGNTEIRATYLGVTGAKLVSLVAIPSPAPPPAPTPTPAPIPTPVPPAPVPPAPTATRILGLSPTGGHLIFINTAVGQTNTQTFTISNSGNAMLTWTKIETTNQFFAVDVSSRMFTASPGSGTVSPGQSATVTLSFTKTVGFVGTGVAYLGFVWVTSDATNIAYPPFLAFAAQ
jgi:hypothetical protein